MVARHVPNDINIRALGYALELKEHDIEAVVRDNRHSIVETAFAVLQIWRQTVGTPAEAYSMLVQALLKLNLKKVACDALGYDQ